MTSIAVRRPVRASSHGSNAASTPIANGCAQSLAPAKICPVARGVVQRRVVRLGRDRYHQGRAAQHDQASAQPPMSVARHERGTDHGVDHADDQPRNEPRFSAAWRVVLVGRVEADHDANRGAAHHGRERGRAEADRPPGRTSPALWLAARSSAPPSRTYAGWCPERMVLVSRRCACATFGTARDRQT